jgi:transposase
MQVPRPRSAMRKIREVLRLTFAEGLSRRQVGAATGLPYTTVADHLGRARRAGLGWPLPAGLDDRALEGRLFASAARPASHTRPLPDWAVVHRELRRKGVTLQLLHLEYKERHPDGYQYSQFCRRYRLWQRGIDLVMRQEHRAGERCFPDFAGQTLPIVDPASGEVSHAELFVAVLGASSYTYAEALPSQALPHWIAGHVHAFEFFGGAPRIVVPDNLRAAVTRAHRYEPELNPTYAEMAAHYGCAVVPARPRRPRDKAKAEVGVQVAERWILAALRNRTFFSLAEANAAIGERLAWLNARPFKKLDGSRRSLFTELERPALRPLPAEPYRFAVWKLATVSIDYHLEVEGHYYSVPYQLVGERCEVRVSAATVEIFQRGRRVASHLRGAARGRHTTLAEHMPESHRRYAEWTPSRIVRWAQQTGPATGALAAEILASRPHPEQGFRSCLGILRLGHRYGAERLEAACRRALAVRAASYRSVESILKTGLDRQPLPAAAPDPPVRRHANLRGAGYYE